MFNHGRYLCTYLVLQCIRDGVIDATIDHANGYVQTKETFDVYVTAEPYHQLDRRINFCLGLRNQSVIAMRYPPNI